MRLLAASISKAGFTQPKLAPPSQACVIGGCGSPASTLMLEQLHFSWLSHAVLHPVCNPSSLPSHPQVGTETVMLTPLTWKTDHSQGLLSKLSFTANWPELDPMASLSLK